MRLGLLAFLLVGCAARGSVALVKGFAPNPSETELPEEAVETARKLVISQVSQIADSLGFPLGPPELRLTGLSGEAQVVRFFLPTRHDLYAGAVVSVFMGRDTIIYFKEVPFE